MSSEEVNIVLDLSPGGEVLSFSVQKVVNSEGLTEIKSNSDSPESCPICTCRISVYARKIIPKLKNEVISDNEDFREESDDGFGTKVGDLVSSDEDEKPIVELFLATLKEGPDVMKPRVPTINDKKTAPLRCLHCNSVFRNEQNWNEHKKRLGIEEPVGSVPVPGALQCPDHCKRFFGNREELKTHLKNAKRKTYTYKCEKCPEVFINLRTWRRHLFKHGSVRCHKCNEKFKDNKTYTKHMETHVVARSHRCKICAAAHESEVTLAIHMRFFHENNRACSFCGKTFAKWQSLLMHENAHQNIYPFVCEQCGASFSKQASLQYHMEGHMGIVYICDFCGVSVKRKHYLSQHIFSRHVSQEKYFDCTYCAKRFASPHELRRHQTVHDEKPIVEFFLANMKEEPDIKKSTYQKKVAPLRCLHCNTVFRNEQNWNFHKKRLGIEEPVGSVPVPGALKCPNHCKRYFADKQELQQHLKNANSTKRAYKCEKCPEVFRILSTYRRHLFKHGSVRCHKCNHKCKDNKAYTKHMETTHVVARSHRCKICAAAHESEVTLAIHMRFVHENDQTCSFCGKTFVKWQSLLMHENAHQNIFPFVCEQCGASFSKQATLNSHMEEHMGVVYTCDICGLSIKRKYTLRHHMISRHITLEKTFICSHCPKRFTTGYKLKCHEKIHGERDFPCPTCEKRFPTQGACKKHIKSMHTDLSDRPKFECEHCGKIFLVKYSMKAHMKTHTDAIEFRCRYCPKVMTNVHNLRRHEMMHTDERPYTCQICGKAFRHTDTLKTHMRLHTGEKPYECPVEECKRRFSDRGCFRGHLLQHEKHMNIKLVKKKNYLND